MTSKLTKLYVLHQVINTYDSKKYGRSAGNVSCENQPSRKKIKIENGKI